MRAQIIQCEEELRAVEWAWRSLVDRANGSPFQNFDWIFSWWITIGRRRGFRLYIGLLWEKEQLVAAFPTAIRTRHNVRLLEWLGADVTDYGDVLTQRDAGVDTRLEYLWEAMAAGREFDVILLRHVHPNALCHALLETHLQFLGVTMGAPYLQCCWSTGDDWLASLASNRRRGVVRPSRRLKARGNITWQLAEPGEPIADMVDELLRQKCLWMQAMGISGVLGTEEGQAFVRTVAEAFHRQGTLHISTFTLNGRALAGLLGFLHGSALLYYLPAYDVAERDSGPGIAHLAEVIKWSCEHRVGTIDFLRGLESYKLRSGSGIVPLRDYGAARGLLGRGALSLFRRLQRRREPNFPPNEELLSSSGRNNGQTVD